MTDRCRVSEEDARDPHFDGEPGDVSANYADELERREKDRDRFGAMLLEISLMAERLFRDKNFEPDADDFAALENLNIQLKYYEKVKKL